MAHRNKSVAVSLKKKKKKISFCVFPEGPVVQEEQMDCGATNPDPSATIAQVNNWCQAHRT